MRKLFICVICYVLSGCASYFGEVHRSQLMEAPKREFTLSNDYKKITLQTVHGKKMEVDTAFCKGKYISAYADLGGVYYLAPIECGADFTGGVWISNDPSYQYLHSWFIPKKAVIDEDYKRKNGILVAKIVEISEAKLALKKNPAKFISEEMYQEIISSKKNL